MASVVQPVLANCFAAGAGQLGTAIPQGSAVAGSLGNADGALFDTLTTTGGTLVYGNVAGRPCCTVTLTASNQACTGLWAGGGMIVNAAAQNWFRKYLYTPAWPSAVCTVAGQEVSGSKVGDVVLNANGTLSVRNAAGTVILTTTSTVPVGAWYRIEGYFTSNASTGQAELKLFTSPDSITPAETQTSAANQSLLGGNVNQMRYGSPTGGPSGYSFSFTSAAHSTTGYIGPGPVVFHQVCGAPTPSGFTVCAKPTGGTSLRLKVATDPGLSENVTWVSAQVPDQYGYVRHVVSGLNPATLYYCQLADTPPGGTEALAGPVCQCTTLPPAGSPASFSVAFASCIFDAATSPDPDAALADWVAWAAEQDAFLGLFLGDYHYADSTSASVSVQLGNIEQQSMYYVGAPVTTSAWGYSCRSDHDSTTDGGDSDNDWTAANLVAFQEAFPFAADLPDPNDPVQGLYQSFVCGRVRFIVLDQRNVNRSPVADADNGSKTMLGADQLAWLQAELVQPEPLKVIVCDTNWMGNGTAISSCGPGWTYYMTERAAILSYIAGNASLVKNVMLWHGDAHGVGCVPGWGNADGGFPVYCAAPLRNAGIAFTSEIAATFAQSYNNGGGQCRLYGRVAITDDGQSISVTFQGWDAVEQTAQAEQTDTFNVLAGYRQMAGVL
jgi:hypothetical protein